MFDPVRFIFHEWKWEWFDLHRESNIFPFDPLDMFGSGKEHVIQNDMHLYGKGNNINWKTVSSYFAYDENGHMLTTRQKYAPQEVIRLLVAHLDYHLVVGGDPQIALEIAEAMFEALPPFFAQCIFCMWLGITGFKLQHFSVKTLVKKFHWVVVPFIYFDFLNMSQLLVLGKVESGGGPIFKVVLEC